MHKAIKPGTRTIPVTTKLPVDWVEGLKKLSDAQNPVSALVREAVLRFLRQNHVQV